MHRIVRAIEQAGVVGAGGAGFPTHLKASATADTVIANYAECEPLVASDTAVVLEDPGRVVAGLRLMQEATGAEKAVVALKRKESRAVEALEKLAATGSGFSLHLLDDVYPAGDEHVLVEEVTGRVVPQGGIPPQVSVLVSNVTTLWRVALAEEGRPFTERFVTVCGEVKEPATLLVPLGTSVERLVDVCGGRASERCVLVLGGPMMGEITEDWHSPVRKTTTAVIVLPEDNPLVRKRRISVSVGVRRAMAACMQCSDCTLLCPRYLLGHQLFPHKAMRSVAFWIRESEAELASALLCSECGLCGAFACTMELSPVQVYQQVKQELARLGTPSGFRREPVGPRPEREGRRIPTARLVARSGLGGYEAKAPAGRGLMEVDEVKIPLREKWGTLRAAVREGQTVEKGALVAVPGGAGTGARAHASIRGTVKAVTEEFVHVAA
ncbi:MAG: 4Fe-4S dicluster domain-containing protein [Candidatus Eiseniibacteriota bacterium]|nr:MAG: 4Fe-4S dicluster domain-containing protein [Candidatus Eisenbacteria bacterium]